MVLSLPHIPASGSIASNYPSPGHVWPFTFLPTSSVFGGPQPVGVVNPCFPVGSCIPFGSCSYSDRTWDAYFEHWYYARTNVFSRTLLAGRAYILPQRVFVTNGWHFGTNSLLWDMYGDGRMFLPRLVCECGFLSQQNVLPFDASLWEQLHFRGEYTPSKIIPCYPFSGIDNDGIDYSSPFNFKDVLWFDGVTRPFGDYANMHISLTITNQNLFGTNMLSPSQFPFIYEMFGLPSAGSSQSAASWRFMRYVPDSIQRGDFGVALRNYRPDLSASQWAEIGKGGIRGLCFAPVNRQNGATLRFSRFVFQPIVQDNGVGPFGRLTIFIPSGLAWDSDGGCCFNWSKDGQPLSQLFKWPLTASWDFSYQIDIHTNGNLVSALGGTTHTNINSRVPSKDPTPPDNTPLLPSPPRGGNVSFSGGGVGAPTFIPFNPSGQSFSFTSGIILGSTSVSGGSGGRETPIASSSLEYNNTSSPLPVNESGDLVGEYKLNLPTYGDFYTWEDVEDRNSLQFEISSGLADDAALTGNDALWDFSDDALPSGPLGEALQSFGHGGLDLSEGYAPEENGFYQLFDTGNEWFYERLPFEAFLPRYNTLVFPWPEHTSEGWDWEATRTYELPERLAEYRGVLLYAVGIGLSLLFVAGVMALFSGGN